MSEKFEGDDEGMAPRDQVARDLVHLMSRDLIFTIRFLGESQHRLRRHFRDFLLAEFELAGMTAETHPMITAFAERHAVVMRDFVFTGVALSRQYRVEEFERFIGDVTSLLRVDIWDQLNAHIAAAETDFRTQMPTMPALLEEWRVPPLPTPRD